MTLFTIILIILFALSISGLVVGVANDAVNFINSALGSKAAPYKIIMIVASVGIILGAMFSSGMMEVARSGVFHPQMFSFGEIMMLFLAVMLTNVILLDVFNTLGLPTSTTVSLVFSLLGSAIGVAMVGIWKGEADAGLAAFIDSSKTMGIISGILLSVVVAFVFGSIVMYITRMLFSFRYETPFRKFGAIWCGFALTAISYFAVIKGLTGTKLLPAEATEWIAGHTFVMLCAFFVVWTLLMWLVQHVFKKNILVFTVLAGTFSLALAFAGNDLVNFIGVFMAGFDSYNIVKETGDVNMMMGGLNQPVVANVGFLLGAGIIMVITLWTSKKAKSVTETEISLARQDSGVERFGSTSMSRSLVRGFINMSRGTGSYVPERLKRIIETRFKPAPVNKNNAPFDLIRATVNLTLAAILISIATSWKLPLSTTYVTFMVGMGSSLSDRAWGRESAVYRITGVLTVISGWFLTAFIALFVSFVIALVLMYGQVFGVIAMVALCAFSIYKSTLAHRKRQSEKQRRSEIVPSSGDNIVAEVQQELIQTMQNITEIYDQTLIGLFNEDRRLLKRLVDESEDLFDHARERKYMALPTLKKIQEDYEETGHYYIQVVDYVNEVTKSLVHITRPSYDHINNNHEGLSKDQIEDLTVVMNEVNRINHLMDQMLITDDFSSLDEVLRMRDSLFEILADAIKKQIRRTRDDNTSTRNSVLYLQIINETKTMILQSRNLIKSQKYFLGK